MSLVERLEKLAKQLDRERWDGSGKYRPEKAEQCDLLLEAAKALSPTPIYFKGRDMSQSEWDALIRLSQ